MRGNSIQPLPLNPPPARGGGDQAWLLAVAACGALVCCQSLPYELPMLVLVLPYLGELFTTGRGKDQAVALVIAGFAAFAMLPGGEGGMAENFAYSVGGFVDRIGERIGVPWHVTDVFLSHRSLGVVLVSVTVLARGAVRTIPSPLGERSRGAGDSESVTSRSDRRLVR